MERLMKRCMVVLVAALVLFPWYPAARAGAASSPPSEGDALPDFSLPIPLGAEELDYLGVKGDGSFKVPQMQAGIVILEIFSMYCPYCQKEAPVVNELFRLVENEETLKGRVKLIGIGAGNSPYEVNFFKTKYNVPFPLLPDPDFSIHKALGETRTPYFIAVSIDDSGSSHKVIYSKVGSIEDAQKFLDLLLTRSGMKKEG